MLTWDLVRARATRDSVVVKDLTDRERETAEEVAAAYLEVLREGLGRPRKEVLRQLGAVTVPARSRKIADGLRKLLDDRSNWAMVDGPDPRDVRDRVFELAARRRRELGPGDALDREALLEEAGTALGLPGDQIEDRLFADLKESWRLQDFELIDADRLVRAWELANRQALLLRATHVVVEVRDGRVGACRALFRKLKFLRLLHRIEPLEGEGYRIEIEGPFALFEQVTKYGLQLALLLPTLRAVGRWTLRAEILWGAKRVPRTLTLKGDGPEQPAADRLPDELSKLLPAFKKLDSGWSVRRASALLQLPGEGLCVPDLRFSHPERGVVYLELMGYWSRDAVWKRVELVEAGLQQRVVFALSSRLRVSEAALGDEVPSALYVFKGAMSAKRVLETIEGVASR